MGCCIFSRPPQAYHRPTSFSFPFFAYFNHVRDSLLYCFRQPHRKLHLTTDTKRIEILQKYLTSLCFSPLSFFRESILPLCAVRCQVVREALFSDSGDGLLEEGHTYKGQISIRIKCQGCSIFQFFSLLYERRRWMQT